MLRLTASVLLGVLGACDNNTVPILEADTSNTVAAASFVGSGQADPKALAVHGERLLRVLGCKACHGEDLRGNNVTKSDPTMGEWWAPNVTLLMADYSVSELDRLIRHGEPKNGRALHFMPAQSLQFISDADSKAVIAYLRALPPGGERMPPVRKGPTFIELEKNGEFAPSREMVRRFRSEQPVDLGERHRLGRYVAMTVCSECHNAKLQGFEGFSPNLDIAGGYNAEEMTRLPTTSEGMAKKNLGLMSASARHRFAHFAPAERNALISYLSARAHADP